jgi:hypothetical protein
MGTRTIFQVFNGESNLVATLFANSSHSTQFAETVFEKTIKGITEGVGPNALIEKLLSLRYETDEGNHHRGERIFWLVPADEAELGDREVIIKVAYVEAMVPVPQGHTPRGIPTWRYERVEVCKMDETTATGSHPILNHETYTCSCADGLIEWGYCFKQPDSDDIEFDLVIDKATADIATAERINADFARLEWAANAISAASAHHSFSVLN